MTTMNVNIFKMCILYVVLTVFQRQAMNVCAGKLTKWVSGQRLWPLFCVFPLNYLGKISR